MAIDDGWLSHLLKRLAQGYSKKYSSEVDLFGHHGRFGIQGSRTVRVRLDNGGRKSGGPYRLHGF